MVFSLYWFAAQHKTSTYRRKKLCSIYLKFSVQWSEVTHAFANSQEVALNYKNQRIHENVNLRVSLSMG